MAKKFIRISFVALTLCVLLALATFAYSTDIFGKVEGLESGVDYTCAKYDFTNNAYGEFKELTAETSLTAGVWSIKAGDAEPEELFVVGTDSGYVNWYNNETGLYNSGSFAGKVEGYVPGKWSVNPEGIYRSVGSYKDTEIILWVLRKNYQVQRQKTVTVEEVAYPVYAVAGTEYYLKDDAYYAVADNALYEGEDAPVAVSVGNYVKSLPLIGEGNKLQESVVSYGFTNEQVAPANKVVELAFDSITAQAGAMILNTKSDGSNYVKADIKGTFTWVVKVPGVAEEERYTINIDATQKVFTAPAAMANSNGYVVAIEYAPYAYCPDDIFVGHPSDGSAECYAYINPKEGRNAVAFEATLPAAPTSVQDGYGTIYVDEEYDIEIAPATISADGTGLTLGEWTDYEYDVAAERNLAGLYAVRGKYNGAVTNYTLAYAYGDKEARAALGQFTETEYIAVKGGTVGFAPGYWANTKWASGSSIATHSTFGKTYLGTLGAQTSNASTTALKNAIDALASLKAAETPDAEAIAKAEATLLAKQTVVANEFNTSNYTYAYDSDEIINVNEVGTFQFSQFQNNGSVIMDYVRSKVIAYVADREGNVTPYTYTLPEVAYTYGKTITYTVDFSKFLPEEGWLVGIQVYPCTDIAPEELKSVRSTGNIRWLLRVDPAYYTIGDEPSLPESDEKPEGLYADKGIVKGFDADRAYAWAPFSLSGYSNSDWTVLPAGITEYDFEREGVVAIKFAGDGYSIAGSAEANVVLGGSSDNILHLVTMNTSTQKTVTVDGTAYNVFSIDGTEYYLNGDKYYAVADNSEYTGENAANAAKVFITKDVPEVVYLENNDDNTYNVKFNEGKWSGLVLTNSLALNYGFDALCLGTTNTPIPNSLATALRDAEAGTDSAALATARANAAKKSNAIYYSYAFKPEEVIKMADFESFDYRATMRQGGFKVQGTVETKFVFKVIDDNGNLVDRVATKPATYDGSGKKQTLVAQDFDDLSGHIVGIVIYPYVLTDGSYLKYDGDGGNGDYNIYLYNGGYKVTRTLPASKTPEGIVFEGNKISGLDADTTYEYGLYSIAGAIGEWTTVTGVTEITHDLTGLIGLRNKGDGIWYGASAPVVGYLEGDVVARGEIGNVTDGKPAYQTSSIWIPGTWTGSYLSWHDQVTGAYSFLDQSTGVTCSDVETLWLYQNDRAYVEEKLAADAANTTLPASWITYKVTSNPSRLQAIIDAHYKASDYAETLEANKLAHQTKIANAFAKRHIAYALDETEILPVDELLTMSFTSKKRQGGFIFGSVKSKVVVHVMDAKANVTTHEWWSDTWSVPSSGVWEKISVDVQSIETLPESGWIVGVEFYPWADVEPSSITAVAESRIDASNIAYSFSQQHVCIGYYPADYGIKIAAPVIEYNAETGVVSGLDANLTYKYAPYSANGAGEATTVTGVTSIQLTEGLWGIYACVPSNTSVVSLPAIVLYHADGVSADLGTILDKGTYKVYDCVSGDVWVQGKWSGKDAGVHSSFGTYTVGSLGGHVIASSSTNLYNAIQAEDAAAEAAARAEIVKLANDVKFRYAYTNEEILSVNDLLRVGFKIARRQGSLNLVEATAKVTFFVVDENGFIKEYVWESDRYSVAPGVTTTFNAVPRAIENWPETGYVVGFQINPWSDVDGAAVKLTDNGGFHTLANMTFVPASYSIVTGNEVAEKPVLAVSSNNRISVSNYNDVLSYVYSVDGGETWVEFEGNGFTATKASADYIVKSLANYPYEESEVSDAIKSKPIAVVGSTLILDGRIGTRVYLEVDTDVVDPTTLIMHSTKANSDYANKADMSDLYRVYGNSNMNIDWLSARGYDEEKDLYYFTFYVPAKDADNVSFETQINYTLDGENITFGSVNASLKVTEYIETAKALAEAGDAAFVEALPLVEALEAYVSYADNYFGKGEDAAYVSTASTEGITAPTRTNAELVGVSFYGTSLLLEDQVTIRHYFAVEDLDAFNAAYNVAGKYGVKGNFIYFDIADIPAQDLGKVKTLTIKDAEDNTAYEVTYSATNYIAAMMNDNDVNLASLVNAMYDYYLAAVDYAK